MYIAPALVVMALVVVFPFIYNVVVSFSNMNLTHFRDWNITGIGNYVDVLARTDFWYYLFKTILCTGLNLIFHVGFGLMLALIINEDIRGKTIFRTLLILPWAVPQYITALTWRGMFNSEYGAVNLLLGSFLGIEIPWLSKE